MGYIYKIKNKIDNKTYIGQTTQDLEDRWKAHLKKRNNCRYLKSALNKYGVENFEFKLVCITFDNQLDDMEIKYIEQYKCLVPNGYNIRLGGNSGKHHEETKRKIGEALKNRYKNGMVHSKLGKHPSEETRKKLSEARKGKKLSRETIDKGVMTRLKQRNRKIIQYDIHGNRLNSFDSCKEAGEYIGSATSTISSCCTGRIKTKTAKGYIWTYESINSNDTNSESEIQLLIGRNTRSKAENNKLVMPRKKQRNDKIIQYDIRGNRLNSFDTCKEAADYIGTVYTNIYMCLTEKTKTAKGYIWKYESINSNDINSESGIPPLTGSFKCSQESINKSVMTRIHQRNRKIIQYSIDGNRINSFDTCTEAAKYTGISRSGITHCCLGVHKTAKGYVWKYESIL